jgi:mycothiol synthase
MDATNRAITSDTLQIVSRLEDDHVDRLEELIRSATLEDGHGPIGEHKFLRLKHGDDLGVAVLAYQSDELAGYAHTLAYGDSQARRVSCELVVEPTYRRRGIGSALLRKVIEHAKSQHATSLGLWAYNDSKASQHLARSFSLSPERRLLHMHRHSEAPPAAPTPLSASVRPLRAGEEETLLALNNRIFEGHPENGSWTLEDLKARQEQTWFDAADVLMLEEDGALAGFCWLKIEERGEEGRVGEIYVIGNTPEFRGRGLGRYLLSAGLQHLSRRNVNVIAVYVDQSNDAGVSLYHSFEFHHHHVDVMYSLTLGGGAG